MNRIFLQRSILRVLAITVTVGIGGISGVSYAADPQNAANLNGVFVKGFYDGPRKMDVHAQYSPMAWPAIPGWGGMLSGGGDTAQTVNPGDYDANGIPNPEDRNADHMTPCQWGGDPIVFATGNVIEPQNDFAAAGEMGLTFDRTYNAYWDGIGILGQHWVTSFDYKLLLTTSKPDSFCYAVPGTNRACDATDQPIWAQRTDGKKIKFNYVGGSPKMWVEDRASPVAAIIQNADGTYTLSSEERTLETYDKSGFPKSVLNEHGVGWSFTWTTDHLLTKVTHSSGRAVVLTWTGYRLTSITDPAGNVFQYSYVGNYTGPGTSFNRVNKVVWPGVSNTANGGTPTTTIQFDDGIYGRLTSVSYNNALFSSFQYDSNYMGSLTTSPNGVNKHTFSYETDGGDNFKVTGTNPLGLTTKYTYNKGKLVSTEGLASANCPARQSSVTYDANGNRDRVTDYRGIVTDFDFDAKGHLLQVIENADAPAGAPDRRLTTNVWDADDRLVRSTVAGYKQVDTTYTANGRVASITVTSLGANGGAGRTLTTSFAYTTAPNGIVTKTVVTGPTPGSAVTYNYNSFGDLISVVDALGHATTYSGHNGLGLPGSVTDPNGDVTNFSYDPLGRVASVSKVVNGAAQTTKTVYNAFGKVTRISLPDGREIYNTYDAAYRLTKSEEVVDSSPSSQVSGFTDSTIKQTVYTYNANSDVLSVVKQNYVTRWTIDPGCDEFSLSASSMKLSKAIVMAPPPCTPRELNSTIVATKSFFDYDELGQLIGVRGNNGQNVRRAYDVNGNLTKITDSAGKVTSFEYDALNRQVHIADAGGGHTWRSYDQGDQTTSVVDPRGLTTQYGYDAFSQLWWQVSPDTGTTSFTYDSFGRRTGQSRANGKTSSYTYDGLDRVTTITAGGQTQNFAFDSCTNGIGRLCSTSDPSGVTSYSYTPQGWISSQSVTPMGFAGHSLSYGYDGQGRVATMDYDSGLRVTYSYAAGRIAKISTTILGVTKQIFSTYYDAADQLQNMSFGNSVFRGRNFDLDGRITSISTNLGTTYMQKLAYGWDTRNRITGITNNLYPSLTQTFAYDDLSRLTGITSPILGAQGFAYDPNGNRTQQSWATSETVTLTAGTNWLASRGGITFGHDSSGNRLSRNLGGSISTYTYDAFDRLGSVTQNNATTYCEASSNSCPGPVYPSGTTYYQVNALGQRVSKSGPKGAFSYTYDQGGRLATEVSPSGTTNYIYANSEPVALVRNGTVYYLHNDHLGRPESVSNGAAVVVWRAESYAFDRKVVLQGLADLDIGLPGQVYDGETGHWNNGFRDYDSLEGRYLQSDPIGLSGGVSTYAYVRSNPIKNTDALGLCPNEHNYSATFFTRCSGQRVFAMISQANVSAPGAPRARPGFTPSITLVGNGGNNKISQYVNPSTMTIVNTTLPGHQFYPGTVTWQVTEYPDAFSSYVTVSGTGSGPNPMLNDAIGYALFGGLAALVALSCEFGHL
ncbi:MULTISPECIES: RHS repeat-associated core domain-containing protein [Dyella]|uniref:RHS repeat protein n=2 Tax=Dyella TaxID=231454 RepID=A0A4R0YSY8_9GAMM|nr:MULTISPECIES: RHS repeat-associated core domain-containing protein [Dyella]TBR36722.1 RHS repeat protein [Dyella terrae]TCI08187.1 RHS repeat protein [Dyella soli]